MGNQFLVIVHAANSATEYIKAATIEALRLFADKHPKVVVRNAEAYDPTQHEKADAILTSEFYGHIIDAYRERKSQVIVFDPDGVEDSAAQERPEVAVELTAAFGAVRNPTEVVDVSVRALRPVVAAMEDVDALNAMLAVEQASESKRTVVVKMIEKRLEDIAKQKEQAL